MSLKIIIVNCNAFKSWYNFVICTCAINVYNIICTVRLVKSTFTESYIVFKSHAVQRSKNNCWIIPFDCVGLKCTISAKNFIYYRWVNMFESKGLLIMSMPSLLILVFTHLVFVYDITMCYIWKLKHSSFFIRQLIWLFSYFLYHDIKWL